MVKDPPAANVPPICSVPLASAPVENSRPPRLFPVISPPPFSPLTATNTDPLSESPLFVPDRVPPLLVKSTPLPAKTAVGRANAKTASKSIFFICTSPESYFARSFITNDAWLSPYEERPLGKTTKVRALQFAHRVPNIDSW